MMSPAVTMSALKRRHTEACLPAFHADTPSGFSTPQKARPSFRRQFTVASSTPAKSEMRALSVRRPLTSAVKATPQMKRQCSYGSGIPDSHESTFHAYARAPHSYSKDFANASQLQTKLSKLTVLTVLFLPWILCAYSRSHQLQLLHTKGNAVQELFNRRIVELETFSKHNLKWQSEVSQIEKSNSEKVHKLQQRSKSYQATTQHARYKELEKDEDQYLVRIDDMQRSIQHGSQIALRRTYSSKLPSLDLHLEDTSNSGINRVVQIELAPVKTNSHAIAKVLEWIEQDQLFNGVQLNRGRGKANVQELHARVMNSTIGDKDQLAYFEHHRQYLPAKNRVCITGRGPNFVIHLEDPPKDDEHRLLQSCFGEIVHGRGHLVYTQSVQIQEIRIVHQVQS